MDETANIVHIDETTTGPGSLGLAVVAVAAASSRRNRGVMISILGSYVVDQSTAGLGRMEKSYMH